MKIIADLHTHTLACGHAYGTIMENSAVARERGIEYLAITDHGVQLAGAPHYFFFGNMQAVPDYVHGVRILRGVECNIINEYGRLDMPHEYLAKMDIVLAGLHVPVSPIMSAHQNTTAMIEAMRNPFLDIIVHPENPAFDIEPERLVLAAKEYGVALEVNNASLTTTRLEGIPVLKRIVEIARDNDVLLSIGSDAHFPTIVGELSAAVGLLTEFGFPLNRVLNFNAALLKAHLTRRVQRNLG